MPTYEYRCKACGHELEVVQSFTDDALSDCPECDGDLRKVYGNVGISFKGSGFYKNDVRKSGKGASSTTTSTTSTESSSSSDNGSKSTSDSSTSKSTSDSTSKSTSSDSKKPTKSASKPSSSD